VYWLVAALMIAGALGSALSGSFAVLIGFRCLLGSALTLVLPEPAGRSLDEIEAGSHEGRGTVPAGWPRHPNGFPSPVPRDLSYAGARYLPADLG
jgi:hypothetical protein